MFKIDPAQDSFKSYMLNGNYYVDKTEMIYEYLEKWFESKIMFTRPRRFGKTMIMTMFRDFLDIKQKGNDLFKGLKIMEHVECVNKYMHQYPVLFISFKEMKGESAADLLDSIRVEVSKLAESHNELADSANISDTA